MPESETTQLALNMIVELFGGGEFTLCHNSSPYQSLGMHTATFRNVRDVSHS